VIEFKQVTKNYYKLTALRDVSLTIPRGEVLGLLGPNGAGKTTLIKLIAGIITPTQGEIVPANGRAAWPTIGYKPERLVFPNQLAVSQYLEMVAGLCNVDRAQTDTVVLESLARVNLLAAANKQIKTLSKGMRQRLGLAQALIGDPDLLLLDEPTAGMAREEIPMLMEVIQSVREAGNKTIILVEHKMDLVMNVSDRISVMHQGRLLAEGTPLEIAGNPVVQKAYLGDLYGDLTEVK
jgi:ABC-type multidrug transport system ATPase subunit